MALALCEAQAIWTHKIIAVLPPETTPNPDTTAVQPTPTGGNNHTEKSTPATDAHQEPIVANNNSAMIIVQSANESTPRDDNPWTIQTKKKVKRGTVTHKTMTFIFCFVFKI
jgi:hypothetical protein